MTSDGHGANPSPADVVRLTVPADPRYLSAVRLVAASVASDLSFTVDDIEELRIAVDEAVALLIDHAADRGDVHVAFTVVDQVPPLVRVEGTVDGVNDAMVIDPLAKRIIAAVTDSHQLGSTMFVLEKASTLPVAPARDR